MFWFTLVSSNVLCSKHSRGIYRFDSSLKLLSITLDRPHVIPHSYSLDLRFRMSDS